MQQAGTVTIPRCSEMKQLLVQPHGIYSVWKVAEVGGEKPSGAHRQVDT